MFSLTQKTFEIHLIDIETETNKYYINQSFILNDSN